MFSFCPRKSTFYDFSEKSDLSSAIHIPGKPLEKQNKKVAYFIIAHGKKKKEEVEVVGTLLFGEK